MRDRDPREIVEFQSGKKKRGEEEEENGIFSHTQLSRASLDKRGGL